MIRTISAGVVAALVAFAAPVNAQQKVKIGFITTLSGPPAIIGKHMKDSVDLALDHLKHRMGGLEVEVVYGDDQFKPEVGVQLAEEMLKKNQVDFVSGIIWSNVMLAVVPVVTGAGHIMVGTNAGASPLAGNQCNELYFSASWNNDESPEALGKYLQDKGVDDLYVMAPNYQAGKDMVSGLKRYYKGKVADEVYTKFQQQDYQAEISQLRAKNPKAVFVFYPGGMGIQFVKQYVQAGLRDQIPLYSVFTVDETTLPALREAAVGQYEARFWSPDLDVPASKRYVADFEKKYGYTPSYYGAQSYDGIMLIDSAVRGTKGNLKDVKALVREMRKANYDSIRGKYQFNVNQHPIQDFYLLQAVKANNKDGVAMKIVQKAFEKHKDAYYEQCKMKW
ncbi:MAG: ABC transporter substrate-binding protein [Betaproteobacteria bacterium]|nr:MAG: ABC transporter substrate-binding protein [Betaproteobacteria bacterium]TMH38941.1 MAG: ABC transporter substrate-binding protein [Betaproteobacteria bacterium]